MQFNTDPRTGSRRHTNPSLESRQTHLISSQLLLPRLSTLHPFCYSNTFFHPFLHSLPWCLAQFHFPLICVLIHFPAAEFLSVSWAISTPTHCFSRLVHSSLPFFFPTLTAGASWSGHGETALVKLTHTSLPINICSQWGQKLFRIWAVLIHFSFLSPQAPVFDYQELWLSCMSENIHNGQMEVKSFDTTHL